MSTIPRPAHTACRDCQHYIHQVGSSTDSPNRPIWHKMFCRATPKPPAFDPYTGTYTVGKELSDQFEHCNHVNTGHCEKFTLRPGVTYLPEQE